MYLDLCTVFVPLPENILVSNLERCGCWLDVDVDVHLVRKQMDRMVSLREL